MAIAEAVDVDVVTLARVPHGTGDTIKGVCHDRHKPGLGVARVERAYVGPVLGAYARSAAPGTIWLSSLFGKEVPPPLEAMQRSRGWNELAIVPLAQTPKSMDVIEFHFATEGSERRYLALNMIAGILAETWAKRRPGLLTETLLNRTARETEATPRLPLLGTENPARLSRAEFRVCLLLSQGLSNEGIMDELDISLATLRTHLRNIYAKTGAEGHSDLVYKLLNVMPPPRRTDRPVRQAG